MEDYRKVYEEHWKSIIEASGEPSMDQIMRELSDYHFLLTQVPKVYDHVTGGRISKPNTYASEVIQQHDERREEAIEEALKDESPL